MISKADEFARYSKEKKEAQERGADISDEAMRFKDQEDPDETTVDSTFKMEAPSYNTFWDQMKKVGHSTCVETNAWGLKGGIDIVTLKKTKANKPWNKVVKTFPTYSRETVMKQTLKRPVWSTWDDDDSCNDADHKAYKNGPWYKTWKRAINIKDDANDDSILEHARDMDDMDGTDDRSQGWAIYPNEGLIIRKDSQNNDVVRPPCPFSQTSEWSKVNSDKNGFLKYANKGKTNYINCGYKKLSSARLRAIAKEIERDPADGPRRRLYSSLARDFCADPKNANSSLNQYTGETCASLFKGRNLIKGFCAIGDNMASRQDRCTEENLTASVYDSLGNKFCKNNPKNEWCGCYNIINKNCKGSKSKNPGCDSWTLKRDALIDAGHDISVYDSKPQCTAPACSNNQTFQPRTGSSMTCSQKFNICTQNVELGVGKNSPINAECDMEKEGKPQTRESSSSPDKPQTPVSSSSSSFFNPMYIAIFLLLILVIVGSIAALR